MHDANISKLNLVMMLEKKQNCKCEILCLIIQHHLEHFKFFIIYSFYMYVIQSN